MRYPDGLQGEAKLAVKLGWTLVLGGTGHMKWYDPEGILRLVTSMTPAKRRRGISNAKSQLKKLGIHL